MIEIAKKIAHDYEHGFGWTKDENACNECGYRCIVEIKREGYIEKYLW